MWVARLQEHGIPVPGWVPQLPLAGEQLARLWQTHLTDPKAAGELFGLNNGSAEVWTKGFSWRFLQGIFFFFVTLIALFFLFRDGAWIARKVLDTADRLLGDPGERLASKMVDAVRGTVNGTVLVAVGEGVLIGAAYVVAGVSQPVLFTLLTIAFAMVPFGAWAAFSAAAVLLIMQGNAFSAGGVFAFGAIVMLIGDNLVWPRLVGNAARLPFLFALIGIFGGLQTFGLIGLFIGPVIMAALLMIWREWIVARTRETPASQR